jgi:hypothetical protein
LELSFAPNRERSRFVRAREFMCKATWHEQGREPAVPRHGAKYVTAAAVPNPSPSRFGRSHPPQRRMAYGVLSERLRLRAR